MKADRTLGSTPETTFRVEECWQEDGHVTELVVAALADAEADLVPDPVAAHVDECSHCTDRLVSVALLVLRVEGALAGTPERDVAPGRAVAPERSAARESAVAAARPAPSPRRDARFPTLAVALGLCVALLGSVPLLLGLPALALRYSLLGRGFSLLLRGGLVTLPATVARAEAPLLVASFASTALLVMSGWLIARSQSRASSPVLPASLLVALALVAVPSVARAEVVREGTWPEDAPVELSAAGVPRSEAIRDLAKAAGWSLVARDLGEDPVHVHVTKQPPVKVLELLLADGRYVARRDGTLVSISKQGDETATGGASGSNVAAPLPAASTVPIRVASEPDPAPASSVSPAERKNPTKKGRDRLITGDEHIGPDDVARSLFIFGGNVVVEGNVAEDVVLVGGSVKLAPGSYLAGDLMSFGGEVEIENGAQVDGEVNVLGGSLERGSEVVIHCGTCKDEPKSLEDRLGAMLGKLAGHVTGTALLWVFGAILLALRLPRVERVEAEIVRRPWRCLGLGVLSIIGTLVVLGALAITLIGIPLALLGALVAVLAAFLGFGLVVLAGGSVLGRHKTKNPYVHLALGCVAYLLIGALPVVGDLIRFAAVLVGLGAIVATGSSGWFAPSPQASSAS